MREDAVRFGASGELVGICTEPGEDRSDMAVLLLNAGLVHRVGPNRLHVKLARTLSGTGATCLRFDFAGIGDSEARSDGAPFEEGACADTKAAMDYLERVNGLRRFILFGICTGADVALKTARLDSRVVGVVLVNGGQLDRPKDGADDRKLVAHAGARTMLRYYWGKLFDRAAWRRVLTGRTNFRQAARHAGTFLLTMPSRPKTGGARTELEPDALMVVSEGSLSWDILHLSSGPDPSDPRPNVRIEALKGVDHVFTPRWAQQRLIGLVNEWVGTRLADEEQETMPEAFKETEWS